MNKYQTDYNNFKILTENIKKKKFQKNWKNEWFKKLPIKKDLPIININPDIFGSAFPIPILNKNKIVLIDIIIDVDMLKKTISGNCIPYGLYNFGKNKFYKNCYFLIYEIN